MAELATALTAWVLGCVTAFCMGRTVASRRCPTCRKLMRDRAPRQPTFAELLLPPPRDRDHDWRRSFTHENTNRPTSEPPLKFQRMVRLDEGRFQRSNGSGAGYQPKPQIDPKGQRRAPNPPPRNP